MCRVRVIDDTRLPVSQNQLVLDQEVQARADSGLEDKIVIIL